MKISDIKLEMELYGVDSDDITEILELCKSKGYETQIIDDELEKRGYERIFSINYDDYDDMDDFDDEYPSVEKFGHKKNYVD
jgi:molybdenum cofactor biosynthesis enzyme MoaA